MALNKHKASGFTLIELMIVMAIVGILLGVAVPAYYSYLEKTRRLDAISFLQEVAGEQTRYFSENNRYATAMSELGYGTEDDVDSPEGHYNLSVSNLVPTSFTLTATPLASSPQSDDTGCYSFILDSSGLKDVSGPKGAEACW